MKKIVMFDTKAYDKEWFEKCNNNRYEIKYQESKLNEQTVELARGADVICAFVNDDLNSKVIEALADLGIRLVAMRCAGFSNVDYHAGMGKIKFVRVPAYSPYAVAEFAMGMLLCLNRKIHKAYNRTRDFNFNITGLSGMDLHGKTAGVIGTGKIGKIFIEICRGFGMKILAYDLYPDLNGGIEYVSLSEVFSQSDVISLHCPLTEQTKHIINKEAIRQMKEHVILLNTSRGGLCESQALFTALKEKRIGGAGLDVYEEEAEWFFEDHSEKGIQDDTLALLTAMPNVLVTSHQAFLTEEALQNIAEITLENIDEFFQGKELKNEIK
ncbi:MAG: 2-hydroxyacid dehydrogenase [Lachnospiraceae bacterium]